ncbi:MAG: mechanosensitive ion channel family protein [Pseudomonadota bacterium]|nr:mechanosensitive ion channel family protein [Pseudomonadota bacterium]
MVQTGNLLTGNDPFWSISDAASDVSKPPLPTTAELLHWSDRLTHTAIVVGVAVGVALAVHYVLFWLLRRVARASHSQTDTVIVRRLSQPLRWALVGVALSVVEDSDPLLARVWDQFSPFVIPALLGWVVLALVKTSARILALRTEQVDDEIVARSRRTRITLMSRTLSFLIVIITVALMMLEVPGVRQVGATLIASAGIIGLAIGAAAQPALKSLIAGMQIALTEPVRIGDFVVIDGESGRVEDIRLSYVVIRTIDERRFIVPTIKFLDTSFQNWTRVGGITGIVVLPIRPGFDIGPIRETYKRLLAAQAGWDGRTATLVVSEAHVGSIELKMLMSATEPGALAQLRSTIREAMLEWLRTDLPGALCAET